MPLLAAPENSELYLQVGKLLDQVVNATLPMERHECANEDKKQRMADMATDMPPAQCPLPFDEERIMQFEEFVAREANVLQRHGNPHGKTCRKGKWGCHSCRMGYPYPVFQATEEELAELFAAGLICAYDVPFTCPVEVDVVEVDQRPASADGRVHALER